MPQSTICNSISLALLLAFSSEAGAQSAPSPLPAPDQVEAVSLEQLEAWATHHAPALAEPLLGEAAAAASYRAASRLLPDNPELGVEAGGYLGAGDEGYEWSLALSQAIEVGGQRAARRAVARAEGRRREAALSAARWSVHARLHTAFHHALLARERLDLADEALRLAEQIDRIAERRVAAGDEPELSLILATSQLSAAQAEQLRAAEELLASRIELAAISGWPVERPPLPVGALPEVLSPPPLAELMERAEQQPALAALAAEIEEAEAAVLVARREGVPNPALGLRYTQEGEAGAARHLLTGELSLPLPLAGSWRGPLAEARLEEQRARARERSFRSEHAAALAHAHAHLDAAARRLALAEPARAAVEHQSQLLQRAYEAGEVGLAAVVQAREQLLATQARRLDAWDDYVNALAALEQLLGGEV